ncbi:hypothetical protein [Arenimonas sp. MALMAid1274]|uniref:hypothetical protein n=1 Tax=Arenimonas sp. MALMAid1274 TaxID=3411630 RepID=UPI003BA15191
MNAPAVEAAAHFVAKWHRREPEMALAEVFSAPGQRERFRAWGALAHELREAAFELSDARVTAVKCQWWAEELVRLGQGAGRHPVSTALAVPALPWPRLARTLLDQAQYDARPADAAEAITPLLPFAQALAEVEAGLFDAPAADARAIVVHWLLHRLPAGLASPDQARLPLKLLARHGLTVDQVAQGQGEALLADWATMLLAETAPSGQGSLFARLRHRYTRARLQRLAAGKGFAPPPGFASVWRAWRVARGR